MNKKDFWTLLVMNLTSLILLIEHWCGLEAAIWVLCVWTAVSLITHIWVLRDYVVTYEFVREDYVK